MKQKQKKQKNRHPIRDFHRNLINQFRKNRVTFIIYVLLRALVTAIAILQFVSGNYDSAFLCVFTLVLFLLPPFVETTFSIELPSALEVIILFFIFAAEILGELADYYVRYPLWDTMLHTTTGFLAAAVGLSLIEILNKSDRFKIRLSPLFVALVSFCFSMTIGVLWEFFEFGMDLFFHTDMQKDSVVTVISSVLLNPDGVNSPVIIDGIRETAVDGSALPINGYLDIGLIDTMKDLFVNFIGAVVFSIFGFFYAKSEGSNKSARVVERLKLTRRTDMPDNADAPDTPDASDEA